MTPFATATIEPRPKVTTKVTSTRQVDFDLNETMVIEALMSYLREHFPEFSDFNNSEVEIQVHEVDNAITIRAYKVNDNG